MGNNYSMNDFHNKLKIIMEDRKYSVEDLSRHSDISEDKLNKLIKGEKNPSTKDLITLSGILDITANYMMSYTNKKERISSLILKNEIPLDMSQESIEILRRIVSIYVICDEKSRRNILNYLLEK